MPKPRFPESIVARKLINCNQLGLDPGRCHTLVTDSKSSNLAAAAAALVAFRIGYWAPLYQNNGVA